MSATDTPAATIVPFGVNDECGLCPVCRRSDGYLNTGRDHWFVCERHRVCWCAGSNLFSTWRDQTEADWRANAAALAGFRVVAPFHHARPAPYAVGDPHPTAAPEPAP